MGLLCVCVPLSPRYLLLTFEQPTLDCQEDPSEELQRELPIPLRETTHHEDQVKSRIWRLVRSTYL